MSSVEMLSLDLDGGGSSVEYTAGTRTVTLAQWDERDDLGPLYFVAKGDGQRHAGVVEDAEGLANLMLWLADVSDGLLLGGLVLGEATPRRP